MNIDDKTFTAFLKACYHNYPLADLQRLIDNAGWEKLTGRLEENGLIGFAYDAVVNKKVNISPPPEVLALWKRKAMQIAFNNLLYEQEAAVVFAALNKSGLKYILMKGFVGMEALYGNKEIRPVSDLDVMVLPEHFQPAIDVLLNNGYSIEDNSIPGGWNATALEDYDGVYEITLVKRIGAFSLYIDLHRHMNRYLAGSVINSMFPEHELDWLTQVGLLQLGETRVNCMKPEAQFLFTAYHYLLHHMLGGTKWLIDLGQYALGPGKEIDWEWVSERVKNRNLCKLIFIALYLIRDLTGNDTMLKNALNSSLPAIKPGRFEYLIYRRIPFMQTNMVRRYLVFLLLPNRWRDRFKVLLYLLFEPTASLEGRAPGSKRSAFQNAIHVIKRVFQKG